MIKYYLLINFVYRNKFDKNSQEDNYTSSALVTCLLCESRPDESSKKDKNYQEPYKGKI